MVCVDTTFISDIIRGVQTSKNKIQELLDRGEKLTTTRINICEAYKAVAAMEQPIARTKKMARIREILTGMEILELDDLACVEYAHLWQSMKGNSPGDFDLLIAAIALRHGETVFITRNIKHFSRVPGLKVEGY